MSQDLQERVDAPAPGEPEGQTFVEVALQLGGKSAEESKKTGNLDRADEQVDIPRPRNLLKVRGEPRFGALSRDLWQQLFEEVSRSYGRDQSH